MRRILVTCALLASACYGRTGFEPGDSDTCVPTHASELCARVSATCGDIVVTDNCGQQRLENCGSCEFPDYCGGGGIPNTCGRTNWFAVGGSDFGPSNQTVTWGSASGGGLSNIKYESQSPVVVMDSWGNPVVAWQDYQFPSYDQEIYLRRWNGDTWVGLAGSDQSGGLSDDTESSYTPALALDNNDLPVVAWAYGDARDTVREIFVRRFDGTAWVELGGSATGPGVSDTAGDSITPALAVASDGSPTVAWIDATSGTEEVLLRRWSAGAWVELDGSATGGGVSATGQPSSSVRLALTSDDRPILAWQESEVAGDQIYLVAWDGLAWVELDGSASAGGLSNSAGASRAPALTLDGDRPLVAWQDDASGDWAIEARRFNGTSWENLLGTDGGASHGHAEAQHPSVVIERGGAAVVAFTSFETADTQIHVRRWNGNAWIDLRADVAGGASRTSGDSARPWLAASSTGFLGLTWLDDSSMNDEVYLRRWNGSEWEELGASVASGGGVSATDTPSSNQALAINDGAMVVAWEDRVDNSPQIYLRRWSGDTWDSLDQSASAGGVSEGVEACAPSVVVDASGEPTVAWYDDADNQVYVRRWQGDGWAVLAGPGANGGLSATGATRPSIGLVNGEPVVAWQNDDAGSFEVYVRQWNGSDWNELDASGSGGGISNSGGLAYEPVLAVDPFGEPMVAWRDESTGVREIYLRHFHGGTWIEIGGSASGGGVSNLGESEQPRLAIDVDGAPTVAWRECFGNEEVYLKRWNGLIWEELAGSATAGSGGVSAGGDVDRPSLVVDGAGLPVVSWEAGTPGNYEIFLKRWTGTDWIGIDGSDTTGGVSNSGAGSRDATLAISPSLLCVAWTEGGRASTEILMRCSEL